MHVPIWATKLPPVEQKQLKSPTEQPISVPTVGRQLRAQVGIWATSVGKSVVEAGNDDVGAVVDCAATTPKRRPKETDTDWNCIL